jgi:hypothetical protein
MKNLLILLPVIGLLLGCGGDKGTEKPAGDDKKGGSSAGAQGSGEKPPDLKSYLTGKRIVFGQPAKSLAITQNTACRSNMATLRLAIQLWALDKRRAGDAKFTLDDLAPYLKAESKSLKCPAGGKYILTTVEEDPKCSHGHSLDYERGDKLPPAKGPPPRAFWQFNKDGTLQAGKFDENGDAKDNSGMGKATYKVTGPMEVTLEVEGKEEKAKLIFTKPNPAKGDALTLRRPDGREELSKAPILEITPASPLKEKKK